MRVAIRRPLLATLSALVGAASLGAPAGAVGMLDEGSPSASRAGGGAALSTLPPHVAALLEDRAPLAAGLETAPALATAIGRFAADLGVPVGQSLPGTGLSAAVERWLSRVVSTAHECYLLRGEDAGRVQVRVNCAKRLADVASDRSAVTQELSHEGRALDVWPVLRYEPGRTKTVYEHDYAVIVDGGGDDVYDNNASSNLLDVKRGPAGSAAPFVARARGCEVVLPDSLLGSETPDEASRSIPGSECHNAVALLVDQGGDDQYGVLRERGGSDVLCPTQVKNRRERFVRRIGTGGVGVAGVGVLMDEAGDDVYLGKTMTQGAGHLGGVGLLHDRAGEDSYHAMRNAQGIAVVSGVGILRDDFGDDSYDFSVPTGGVLDDNPPPFRSCDSTSRQMQGSGVLGGIGVHLDREGNDSRRAPAPSVATGKPVVNSQGAGNLGGTGLLADLGGADFYTTETGVPLPDRGDGKTTFTGTKGEATGAGVFIDTKR